VACGLHRLGRGALLGDLLPGCLVALDDVVVAVHQRFEALPGDEVLSLFSPRPMGVSPIPAFAWKSLSDAGSG